MAGSRPIHILFVGAGAVGCFYASRCHYPSANVYVSLICRSNYTAIARSGVSLDTHSFGKYRFTPHGVYSSISNAANSPEAPPEGWDYVVVTTKALPDVTDDARDIEPLIRAGQTCIVLIQNGVGVEEPHRTRFPTNPIVSAVTIISAEQTRPGVVRQNRWTRISMGAYGDGYDGGDDQKKTTKSLSVRGDRCARELCRILTEYGQLRDAEWYDETGLQLIRWHKICINGSMNPSAVLSGGIGNALMVRDPDLRAHLKGCMEEVFAAVPRILGREFPASLATPDQILASTERNAAAAKPSMLLDWEAGKPMELEVILGNPIRIARAHGVEMPRLQTLYALLKSAAKVRDEKKKQQQSERSSNL